MLIEIGQVEAIFRYPVKSMRGEPLEAANMGWHGLDGDRRLALRKVNDRSGFPWLTASKLPDLILFTPRRREGDAREDGDQGNLPTHIRTPDGKELPVFGEDLAAEVGRRYGAPVEMMQMKHGIFDDASLSVIASDTAREIARLAGQSPDVRRFRPNVVVRLMRPAPFQEDEWLGGVLSFGEGDDAPAIAVTMHDVRCSMVNLDPDSARPAPEVLKAVVRVQRMTSPTAAPEPVNCCTNHSKPRDRRCSAQAKAFWNAGWRTGAPPAVVSSLFTLCTFARVPAGAFLFNLI
jgi:uncharacterized protein YcbX